MSLRNLSCKSAFFPKSGGKGLLFFLFMFDPRERPFFDQVGISKLYLWAEIYIKCSNRKKMVLESPQVSRNAASNTTHFAIAGQLSSRVETTFNEHCTVHSTVEDFNVKVLCITTQSRYDTVLYCVHALDMMWTMQYPVNCDWGRSAVWKYRELCISLALGSQGCKNRSLARGNNGTPQTGVTLAYTINPVGPSAGRVFNELNSTKFRDCVFDWFYITSTSCT